MHSVYNASLKRGWCRENPQYGIRVISETLRQVARSLFSEGWTAQLVPGYPDSECSRSADQRDSFPAPWQLGRLTAPAHLSTST